MIPIAKPAVTIRPTRPKRRVSCFWSGTSIFRGCRRSAAKCPRASRFRTRFYHRGSVATVCNRRTEPFWPACRRARRNGFHPANDPERMKGVVMKSCPQCKLKYPDDAAGCFLCGGVLVSIKDPLIGTTIAGRYQIEEVLGQGGMATVYAARHRLVDRPCAVKVMNAQYTRNEVIRERFRREAKAAQKLAHPNIIEILDHGKVPLERGLPIMIQIARALARAHDLEVIHRDLKPENVFLARLANGAEQVKLLDFGIARSMQDSRLTGAGEVFGTPQYMAPERITSTEAGPAADLYSLGVIIYEMITGRFPFDASDVTTYFIKHLKEAPASPKKYDPSIPVELERLVLECLAKDAKDRPVDAHRVNSDLMNIAGAI